MQVNRTRRFFAVIVNSIAAITIIGLIVNLVMIFTSSKTIGGIVLGYKYKFSTPGIGQFLYWIMLMVMGFLYGLTFGILWIVDVVMMDKNNGTFAEKIVGVKKINK
ncbi:hypothetical protein MYMA111404_03915 [Mycoplasma marinum]|uniref:RDD domain-containing protein n=1 Tax=Mycoplasma marinum TaxID=1937190 RepID=A0A4V2NI36_9MOLU|nr:hypothetical protein [Mycoplasma marinum]TCG10918.1 hypothetical protein C4B24_03600 [Mycoplasma marinum]